MTQFGFVSAYDEKTRMATIEYMRPDACDKCSACGTAAQKGAIILRADCAVGNWVRIELPEKKFLQAAVLAYGVPLVCFLAGLMLGQWITGSELGGIGGALVGLAVSLGMLRMNEKRIKGRPEWSSRVTEVYTEKPTVEAIGCGGMG